MRIKIEHHQVRGGGLFHRIYHEVWTTVDFTHEERQIIRQRRLADTMILDRRPANARDDDPDEWFVLTLRQLIHRKPDRMRLASPSEAKAYEARLVDALQLVKGWLDANADPAPGRVIEL